MTGGVRLKVEPWDAGVYVDVDDDGYVGVVEAFNGDSQRLALTSGRHRIEIRAPVHHPPRMGQLVMPMICKVEENAGESCHAVRDPPVSG